MMKLLIPVVMLILGLGGGIGVRLFVIPPEPELPPMDMAMPCGEVEGGAVMAASHDSGEDDAEATEDSDKDYARLNNQFIVPLIREDNVASMVVMSVSVEIPAGQEAMVFEHEPKLRDSFLQVMFDHANLGGFDGNFTSSTNMRNLRASLRNAARDVIGPDASDVLILELVRQDV